MAMPLLGHKKGSLPVMSKARPCRFPALALGRWRVILLLQHVEVGGLQVVKDGTWFDVEPIRHAIVIDIRDQLGVMANGKCKSIWHRVLSKNDANRMSIAAFYKPSTNPEVFPAPQLITKVVEQNTNENDINYVNAESDYSYPKFFSKDYMKVYGEQKFLEREPRFEAMRGLYSLK